MQALATRPYQFLTSGMGPYDTLNALAALGALALAPVIWRRFNAGYAVIVVAGLLLPLSSGQFEGLGRYTSVQFPIALVLASFGGDAASRDAYGVGNALRTRAGDVCDSASAVLGRALYARGAAGFAGKCALAVGSRVLGARRRLY